MVGLWIHQNPDLFEKRALEDGLSSCLELNTSCRNSKKLVRIEKRSKSLGKTSFSGGRQPFRCAHSQWE